MDGAGDSGIRHRYGSPWRDPDVWHVLVVGALANVLLLGLPYLWFLWRTVAIARRADGEPGTATWVVLFGKRLAGGHPDREFRWRLRHGLRLLRRNPGLIVLLTGGRGGGGDQPGEADAARAWLLRRMPEAAVRLRVEAHSLDTLDNLRQARALLPTGPVALLSNRYHLARCVALARSLGLEARPCAAEPSLRLSRGNGRRLVLEAGYHMLFVIGRRWARVIGHRRMLARVS